MECSVYSSASVFRSNFTYDGVGCSRCFSFSLNIFGYYEILKANNERDHSANIRDVCKSFLNRCAIENFLRVLFRNWQLRLTIICLEIHLKVLEVFVGQKPLGFPMIFQLYLTFFNLYRAETDIHWKIIKWEWKKKTKNGLKSFWSARVHD